MALTSTHREPVTICDLLKEGQGWWGGEWKSGSRGAEAKIDWTQKRIDTDRYLVLQ